MFAGFIAAPQPTMSASESGFGSCSGLRLAGVGRGTRHYINHKYWDEGSVHIPVSKPRGINLISSKPLVLRYCVYIPVPYLQALGVIKVYLYYPQCLYNPRCLEMGERYALLMSAN